MEIIGTDNKQIEIIKQNIKMPNDFHSEKILLGQLIYSGSMGNKELDRAMNYIEGTTIASDFEKHFYNKVHSKIYSLIYLNYCKQRPISPSSLASVLSHEPYFQNDIATAEVYLEDMMREAGLISQVNELTKQILDLSMKRQLIEISTSVIHDINIDKEAMSSVEYVSEIEKQLANLVVYNEYNRDSQLISGLAQSAIEKISFNMHNKHELTGLTTGFSQLDRMLGGMQKSDLIIIAARPAMGKTSFALCLALNAAEYMRDKADDEKKGSVGFVSLEMSGEQLVTRLISMKSMVNSMKMRSGHINEDEFAKITLATNNLRELDLVIDDNAAISMSELKSKVRRMVLKNKISILFIDYLQLLHGSKKSSDTSRVNEISEISRGLKQIAKELNIPVIALSQLSREIEKREDKMPRLSDLRESGSIEQDADIVMFIHREEYYLRRKEPKMNADEGNSDGEQSEEGYKMTKNKVPFEDKMEQWQKDMESVLGKAEIIIAKHRNGPVGNIELRFDSNTTAFIDPTKYTEDEFFEDESFE